MSVRPGAHYVSLLVVRAQGLVGDVQVEWRTVDGSARAGGAHPDYSVSHLQYVTMMMFMMRNSTTSLLTPHSFVDSFLVDSRLTCFPGAFLAAALWGGQRGGHICIWGGGRVKNPGRSPNA